jgi:hypothetical protein
VGGDDGPDRGPEDVAVLSREVAAALAAERRHASAGPSPIAGVTYPVGSGDLWRWVDRPADAVLSAFVAGYVTAGEQSRARMRASLTMDDLYTVLLFAQRSGFAAIRTGDARLAGEAFDALSTIDVERVDWRDLVVAASLAGYAAGRAGAVPAAAAAGAIRRAEPQVAEILTEAAVDGIDLAETCGYRVVETASGPVLFEDGYERYAPDRELAPIALGIAAVIEGDRTYRVDGLTIAEDLPQVWVAADTDTRVGAALGRVTGCVSISASPLPVSGQRPGDHFLNVWLVEAATAADAALVAGGAGRGGRAGAVVLAVPAGRLCAVLVGACTLVGRPPFETVQTLARFQPAVSALLA